MKTVDLKEEITRKYSKPQIEDVGCWWNPEVVIITTNKFLSSKKDLHVCLVDHYSTSPKKVVCGKVSTSQSPGAEITKIKSALDSDEPFHELKKLSQPDLWRNTPFCVQESVSKEVLLDRIRKHQLPIGSLLRAKRLTLWARHTYVHAAVYLGPSYFNRKPLLFHHAGDQGFEKAAVKLRMDDDPKLFLGSSEYFDIVRYLIPVKRPEMLTKKAQTLCSEYKAGSYDLYKNNCEHAASKLLGFEKTSQQKENVGLLFWGAVASGSGVFAVYRISSEEVGVGRSRRENVWLRILENMTFGEKTLLSAAILLYIYSIWTLYERIMNRKDYPY